MLHGGNTKISPDWWVEPASSWKKETHRAVFVILYCDRSPPIIRCDFKGGRHLRTIAWSHHHHLRRSFLAHRNSFVVPPDLKVMGTRCCGTYGKNNVCGYFQIFLRRKNPDFFLPLWSGFISGLAVPQCLSALASFAWQDCHRVIVFMGELWKISWVNNSASAINTDSPPSEGFRFAKSANGQGLSGGTVEYHALYANVTQYTNP